MTGLPHNSNPRAVPRRWTGTSPTTSPHSLLWSVLDLSRRPSGSQAKSPRTELIPPPQKKINPRMTQNYHMITKIKLSCGFTSLLADWLARFDLSEKLQICLCQSKWSVSVHIVKHHRWVNGLLFSWWGERRGRRGGRKNPTAVLQMKRKINIFHYQTHGVVLGMHLQLRKQALQFPDQIRRLCNSHIKNPGPHQSHKSALHCQRETHEKLSSVV